MAKRNAATAKAGGGEAIPDEFYRDIVIEGVDGEVVIKGLRKFKPGPDGLPTDEELAAVEEQAVAIRAVHKAVFDKAAEEDRKNREAKQQRNAAREKATRDWKAMVEARLTALEAKNG